MRLLQSRKIYFLLAGIVVCIFLISLTAGNRVPGAVTNALGVVIVPVQNVMADTGGWFGNIGAYFNNIDYLIAENQRLNAEIEELLLSLNRLELLEAHNYNLTQLLDMSQRYPRFKTTAADIISRDNNNWNSRFIINRGYNHGVEQNMVVVSRGGLVGKVTSGANSFSQVTPIVDDTSTVGAVTNRSGVTGFIRGDIMLGSRGLVRFETDAGTDIIEGDEIMTSTFGTIYPPGIPIGTIIEITESTTQGRVAIVQPTVNFDNLNSVLVITGDLSEDYYQNIDQETED